MLESLEIIEHWVGLDQVQILKLQASLNYKVEMEEGRYTLKIISQAASLWYTNI